MSEKQKKDNLQQTKKRISEKIRHRVREQAGDRCGYCLSRQRYVMSKLQIEHLTPRAAGGSDAEENLWLACGLCNGSKERKPNVSTLKLKAVCRSSIRAAKIGLTILLGARTELE